MIRNGFIASFTVLALGMTACQVETMESSIVAPEETNLIISAAYDAPADTRTSLSSEGKVLWSKGDEFALFSASGKGRFTLVSGDGTGTAEFSGSITGTAPFYALYPYSDNCAIEDNQVKFSLPQNQDAAPNTFGNGCSPSLATMATADEPAYFKNLCGVLQINLNGSAIKVSRIEVIDLAGAMLWGDCSVVLDGKQGTDEQTMTVTGGTNSISVKLNKVVSLLSSTPRVIDVVVPAGTLTKGYTVKVFDENNNAVAFVTNQDAEAKPVCRSKITVMEKTKIDKSASESADTLRRGYFKDLFMDGGCYLTHRTTLPAMDYLGWEFDYLATSNNNSSDSLLQKRIILGDATDLNGVILYPDNEPRYCMVYMNGGTATNHGRSLEAEGRGRYITFVNNGGSYFGTCAGAFIASTGLSSNLSQKTEYFGIYPSYTTTTGLINSSTAMTIPMDSPLLDYYDFGGDYRIEDVRHNGGCYVKLNSIPSKGEVLLLYEMSGWGMNGNASAWAYKGSDSKGRVVSCGSHPEGEESGERRDLMAAFCRYAVDGNALPVVKAKLENGQERVMDQLSTANKPNYARLGDKQYHHFIVSVPAGGLNNFKITLTGDDKYNLILSLRKGNFAWRTDAEYVLAQPGSNKTLEIADLEEGTWYVSVYCKDAPTVICSKGSFNYSGNTNVLNGVPYAITATWE